MEAVEGARSGYVVRPGDVRRLVIINKKRIMGSYFYLTLKDNEFSARIFEIEVPKKEFDQYSVGDFFPIIYVPAVVVRRRIVCI